MIRRMLFASATVFAFALVVPFTAQAQSVFVLGGISSPSGDFGDYAKTGWLGAVGVTFPVGDAGLWAGVEGSYGQNKHDEDVVGVDAGDKTTLFGVMAILGYDIQTEGNVNPYIWGGAGLQSHKFTSPLFPAFDETSSKFGYQFGAGIGFGSEESSVHPFVEGRFQGSEDSKIIAGEVGLSFDVGN